MISENKFIYALRLADSADVGIEFSKKEARELAGMIDGYLARITELEAENAELKERVAMLDVTAVFKSLGEMGYIEQTNKLHTRIAESESTIERLIEAGKRLLDSLCTDPEEEKTVEVMNWKAVVDKVNKERER